MRILHIAPTGNWAGTEEMVCRLANDVAADHEVAVFMADGEHITAQQIRDRFDPRVRVILADPDATPGERMAEVIGDLGAPDIIHAHLRPGLLHAWHLRGLAPVVGHLHVRFFSAQFWWVDAVVCVSPWQARDIPGWFTGDVFIVPNSLAPFDIASDAEIQRFRRELGVGPTGVVFGSVGRLAPEKGFDVLIKAFRSGFAADDRLVIVGAGPDEEHLQDLARDDERIRLTGYRARARRYLPALDVYVSASRLDSFGLSVLEAMSVGLPIVSTTARGPADLLTGQPALLVPAEDATALRAAMTTAAAADRPVSYQLDRYHHERCAEELIAAYRFLLTRSDPPACVVRERPDTAGGPG